MTETVVVKVGGSVLDAPDDIRTTADRLAAMEPTPVVVVSALNGVTDRLLAELETVAADADAVEGVIDELRSYHLDTALPVDIDRLAPAVDPLFDRLERLLVGIAYTGESTARTRDQVASFGERFSARVVAAALESVGADARALDADELGVVTDGMFGRATADYAATREAAAERLVADCDAGTIPVVTGYFGRSESGEVTTFGRGGSDYAGAVLARVLDADRYEIWKDVAGFLTAQPDRIPDARPIPYMTYDEAAELAYLGVRVLHPRTLEPLREPAIQVVVTHFASEDAAGTVIGPPVEEIKRLRAIGAREGFGIVRMHGSSMAYQPGVGERVFAELSEEGITVVNMAASQATFALLIDAADTARAAEVLTAAAIPTVESVTHETGFALVCIVGRDIGLREGVAGGVFSVVGEAGVNIDMISVGSSNVAMSFVIDEGDLQVALEALHTSLFDGDDSSAVTSSPTAGR